jgi:hypothetical protein
LHRKVTSRSPPPPAPAPPQDAAGLLSELDVLALRARADLGEPWFPLVLFGAVYIAGGAAVAFTGPGALVVVWTLGGVGGLLAVRRHYQARGRRRGVARSGRVWLVACAMAVACFAGALVAGQLVGLDGALAVPPVILPVGYGLIVRSRRRARLALWIAVAAAVALVLIAAGGPAWAVEVVFGTGLVAVGLVLRHVEDR